MTLVTTHHQEIIDMVYQKNAYPSVSDNKLYKLDEMTFANLTRLKVLLLFNNKVGIFFFKG